MDQNKVGQFIAVCRKEKQMTQNDLAQALNVSVQAVSKWERGKNYPDISLFPKLAETLEISVGELLKGERSNIEIKSEETVTELIDYNKTVKTKRTKKQVILSFVLLLIVNTVGSVWSNHTADLKMNPYIFKEVDLETGTLTQDVESAFPFFIQHYDACQNDLTKTSLKEGYKRTFFSTKDKPTSLIVDFGTTDTTKVSETTATLWCPLTLEFVTQLRLLSSADPMVIFDYREPVIHEETFRVALSDQTSESTEVYLKMVDGMSLADNTGMVIITQFTLVLDGTVIKGQLPSNMIKDPELLNGTQKIIPLAYLELVKTNIEQLTLSLLRSQALSNVLDVNESNFYTAYMKRIANYPFKETRQIVYEDNQWRIKQIMDSKETIVTFNFDLKGSPVSIQIDRAATSTSIAGVAGTLEVVATNQLSYWPFPQGYLKTISYNLTENKDPWIIDIKETKMSLICTEYLRHYLIKWPLPIQN